MDDNKNIEQNVITPSNNNLKSSSNNYLIVGVILLVIAAIVILIIVIQQPKPAFTINGTKYTQTSYNTLIAQAKKLGISRSSARSQIISDKKDQFVAQEEGISVPSGLIQQEATSLFLLSSKPNTNNWQYLVSWDNAFHQQLDIQQVGGYEGYLFYFPFDTLFVNSYPSISAIIPNFGNTADIAAAQAYAQTQAQTYRTELTQGTNPETLLTKVLNDSQLQFADASNESVSFSIDTDGISLLTAGGSQSLPAYILSGIKNFNKVGITPIATLSGSFPANMISTGNTQPVTVAYYFIDIQKIITSQPNIQTKISNELKSLKVVVNV